MRLRPLTTLTSGGCARLIAAVVPRIATGMFSAIFIVDGSEVMATVATVANPR